MNIIIKRILNATVIIALVAIMLNSCKEKSEKYFCESLKIVKPADVKRTDVLKGVPVISNLIGISKLNELDSLICINTPNGNNIFTIYSLDGDSITSFGIKGQGPNDFNLAFYTYQNFFSGKNDFGTWIVDPNNSKLKRLNVGKSLKSGSCVVDSIISLQPMVTEAFVVGDTIIQFTCGEGTYDLTMTATDGTLLSKEPLYIVPVNKNKVFYYYNTRACVSPDNKYLVTSAIGINQLNIIDLVDNKRKAVSIGGVKNRDEVMLPDSHHLEWYYYVSITLNNNNIFALYGNVPHEYSPEDYSEEDRIKSEIHVFDYDGNPMCIIPLDRHIYMISYSPKDNCIYAKNSNDEILRYDLSELNL